jgi:hypothetical protein
MYCDIEWGEVGWMNAGKLGYPGLHARQPISVWQPMTRRRINFSDTLKSLNIYLFPNPLNNVWDNQSPVTIASMPIYTPSKTTFELAGKQFPRVTWYKEPSLRRLYITLMFAVLTSATNVCNEISLCMCS